MRGVKIFSLVTSFILGLSSIALANPSYIKSRITPKHSQFTSIHKIKGSKLLSSLKRRIDKASSSQSFPVIVTMKGPSQSVSSLSINRLENTINNFKPTHVFKTMPIFTAKLNKNQIQQLTVNSGVRQVEYDEPVKATMETTNKWYGIEKARSDFSIDGNADGKPDSYSKNDEVIAVIDTGIDSSHVDLANKVIGWKDFVNNQTTPYDDQGHGTHVSSIAAGTGKGNPSYKGVAPGAALVGVKVLDKNGSGTMSNVIEGIDWVIQNKNTYGVRVINMSLGTNGSSDGTDAASLAANRAADAGIVIAVAAGNSGPAKQTVGSPGAAAKALTVGATAGPGEGGFNLAYFSSRGETADGRIKPDVCAPGFNITAAKANSKDQYVTYSGTSMATPFIAGTAALILQANPNLTPAQVTSIISNTAVDFGPKGKDIDYGSGNLNGYDAIKAAGNFKGNGPALPDHLFGQGSINAKNLNDEWTFNVTSTEVPIAITFIMPNWTGSWFSSSVDYDIYLLDHTGAQVAKSDGVQRQETISFTPTKTGDYTLRIHSRKGTGPYFFDISTHGSSLIQTKNNQP